MRTALSPLFSSCFRSLSVNYFRRFAPPSRSMASRSYQDAIEHLNSLQSNAVTLDAVRASGGRLSEFAIPEMIEYLGRIGYRVRTYRLYRRMQPFECICPIGRPRT